MLLFLQIKALMFGQTSDSVINKFYLSGNEIGNKALVDHMIKHFTDDKISIFTRVDDLKFCIHNLFEPTNALRSRLLSIKTKAFGDVFLLKLMLSFCDFCDPLEIMKVKEISRYYYRLVTYYPEEYKLYFLGLFEKYQNQMLISK